jgi:hypothetical protein
MDIAHRAMRQYASFEACCDTSGRRPDATENRATGVISKGACHQTVTRRYA